MSDLKNQKDIPALKEALFKIKPSSYKNTCYRLLGERHNPLSADGSLLCGGRYNLQNIFGALYAGESSEICLAELLQKSIFNPKLIFKLASIKVHFSKVMDLCEDQNLKILTLEKNDLLKQDRRLPQTIAYWAYREGYEAIRSPSTTGKGNILVIFPPNLIKNSSIQLITSKNFDLNRAS